MKDKKAIDATRIIVPKPTSKPLKSGRLSKIMAQLYLKGLKPASNITMALSLLGNELLKNVIVTTNKKY